MQTRVALRIVCISFQGWKDEVCGRNTLILLCRNTARPYYDTTATIRKTETTFCVATENPELIAQVPIWLQQLVLLQKPKAITNVKFASQNLFCISERLTRNNTVQPHSFIPLCRKHDHQVTASLGSLSNQIEGIINKKHREAQTKVSLHCCALQLIPEYCLCDRHKKHWTTYGNKI